MGPFPGPCREHSHLSRPGAKGLYQETSSFFNNMAFPSRNKLEVEPCPVSLWHDDVIKNPGASHFPSARICVSAMFPHSCAAPDSISACYHMQSAKRASCPESLCHPGRSIQVASAHTVLFSVMNSQWMIFWPLHSVLCITAGSLPCRSLCGPAVFVSCSPHS